jgi:hypothetical protein
MVNRGFKLTILSHLAVHQHELRLAALQAGLAALAEKVSRATLTLQRAW